MLLCCGKPRRKVGGYTKAASHTSSNTTTHWRNEYSADGDDVEVIEEKVPVNPREPSPLRSALKKSSHNYYPPRRYYSTDSLQKTWQDSEYLEDVDVDVDSEDMYHQRRRLQQQRLQSPDVYTVGSYGVTGSSTRSRSQPRERHVDVHVEDDVSDVTHRFYDRAGNHVHAPRERSHDIHIQREYGSRRASPQTPRHRDLDFSRDTYQWEEQHQTRKTTTTEEFYEESRDWRDVINQQRQPAPGYTADRRGIAATSASLSNLPTYINRRMESERAKEREYSMPPVDPVVEKYERDEYTRVEERQYPVPVARNVMRKEDVVHQQQQQQRDEVVAVSGKHRCAHCSEELGRGAAMIVESLNLFYHLACFKCYVCKTSLGSGATGADVRVRDGRLHCQTCYSNDRVQLSKV